MSSHYDFALRAAKGEWIQLLGADDSVLPWYFEILDIILSKFKNIDIINWSRAYFFWPDCQTVYENRCLEFDFNHKITRRNLKTDYYLCILGFKSFVDLPQIYTGSLVRKILIDKIRDISGGSFYHSIIPDVYSTVAMLCKEDNYLRVNIPLTLIGTSGNTMHQGNKLYSEYQLSYENMLSGNSILHPSISQEFHLLGLEQTYFLESNRNIPISLQRFSNFFVTLSCYVSLFASFITNDKQVRISREIFRRQCVSDEEFSKIILILCFMLSPILVLIQTFIIALRRILAKINVKFGKEKNGFQSNDREKFKDTYEVAMELQIFTESILNHISKY